MLQGTLKNGFKIRIEDEALDDYEVLEILNEIDKNQENAGSIADVYEKLLGKEQYHALKEHMRGENGRIRTSAMIDALKEIFELDDDLKNSEPSPA